MRDFSPRETLASHRVENQPPPDDDRDAFADDLPLRETLSREAPAWVAERLAPLGQAVGSREVQAWGEEANRHPPELRLFDRHGRRLDEVRYPPAYHRLMALACRGGWHAVAWREEGRGGHQAHVAALYLLTQAEPGFCCPITMTHAALPALRQAPEVLAEWQPKLLAHDYDGRALPLADKAAATLGMAMTEKQGGSDVRANTTRAERDGDGYRLTGHKWFCSAPMSDGFLTLAQQSEGLSCFLVPRFTLDGARNAIELQRLKEKCGNRANASAEIEYRGAWALPVGDPGRGIATILEMVQQTRLDAAIAPVGMMRQALVCAWQHACNRHAFGQRLAEQPLMRAVIADLALEVEAGVVLGLRAARAFDAAAGDAEEAALARLLPTLAKYWHNRRGPGFMAEAMECLGGIGYVEESPLARLYREAPVNSIWEGSGNVICLDLLRVMTRHPRSLEALLALLAKARGRQGDYDRALEEIHRALAGPAEALEPRARWLTQRLAQATQAALLLTQGPPAVAEGFCRSRLGEASPAYGCLPADLALAPILDRLPLP
ncbi:acyl-CoA dehydrogenase family protein [Halomonas sp. 328]|uniref:acyl-CoA dehydrogenase family protein n=1 Tax=Halomonas sp. 328 TaxID=2776704 RepID=UPI0018A6F153|nr:acyl-CoA dehydrogenase family protein [Halomonas sp. 328]MBF8222760.1 acyl-CoA dehydrogenase family protein [Halomonas sp. 328]